ETALRVIARDQGLENIRVADPLDAAERLLPLQSIDDSLHSGVSRSAKLRKCLLNLANGACALLPERLQHLQFQLRKLRLGHIVRLRLHSIYYGNSLIASFITVKVHGGRQEGGAGRQLRLSIARP